MPDKIRAFETSVLCKSPDLPQAEGAFFGTIPSNVKLHRSPFPSGGEFLPLRARCVNSSLADFIGLFQASPLRTTIVPRSFQSRTFSSKAIREQEGWLKVFVWLIGIYPSNHMCRSPGNGPKLLQLVRTPHDACTADGVNSPIRFAGNLPDGVRNRRGTPSNCQTRCNVPISLPLLFQLLYLL